MTNSEIKKDEPNDDQVIAFAISIYESQGYPPNSFEMLDYQMSNKFVKQAQHLIKCGYTRTPEPTKAENGLVPLNIDKVANAIRVFDGNHDKGAGQIAEHICKTFATPSITKEQLLAILPELTKEYFKKDITHADEMLADIQAMSMEIGHLRTNAIMKQRIEELYL